MTTTDQLRTVLRDLEAKAKEMEIDKKLTVFADQADHFLRVAATKAGEYAAENRDRVESTLDKAGAKVDEKTDGKYHAYVGKVRAGVLVGMDWIVEQRAASQAPGGAAASDSPASSSSDAKASDSTASGRTGAPTTPSTHPDAGSTPAPSAGEDAADVTPPGSADSDSWVDVTDTPPFPATHDPSTEGPTDPQ